MNNRSFFSVFIVGMIFTIPYLPTAFAEQDSMILKVVGDADTRPRLLILKPQAMESFENDVQILQELYDLLLFDLRFSGAFQVFEENPQAVYIHRKDSEAGTILYEEWRRLRINRELMDYVMKTILVPHGEGKYELQLLVYDIIQGNRAIGRAYGGAPHPPFTRRQFRRAGHKATAEVITTLTEGKIIPITETRIAFVNYNVSKSIKEIYLIDYDGWPESLKRVTTYNSTTQFPDWSPDGTEMAYISYKQKWPDPYFQHLAKGTMQSLGHYIGSSNTPRWCPDGENLIFSLSDRGKPAELYLIPRSGKNPKRLTHNRWNDLSPDISPDGKQVAYIADRVGSPQLYIMNLDGSDIRRISYINRKCESPFWSPVPIGNEYRIAFAGYYSSQQSDIYTIRPDGTDVQMITDGKSGNLNPSWSPNGRYIAFSSNRSGKHEIYIASSDPSQGLPNGEKFHRVTYLPIPGENLQPAWSPN